MIEQHISSKLESIETMLIQLVASQPPMTKTEFAKRSGLSIRTVSRKVATRQIKERNGRIPFSELVRWNSGLLIGQS